MIDLQSMPIVSPLNFVPLYAGFQSPMAALDCGKKCAPYNEHGVPFCCDTRHAVPTAYEAEWQYLQANTDLWHVWQAEEAEETARLQKQTPANQVLIECQGHLLCQRGFRSLTCRAFPFFPYLNREGEFLGLSYYWDYEDRCWVISHLDAVTPAYVTQFVQTYEQIFALDPAEKENFRHHSRIMRRVFGRRRRSIPLLHRNGKVYKVTPRNGRLRRVEPAALPKFGPYEIAELLRFEDEEL